MLNLKAVKFRVFALWDDMMHDQSEIWHVRAWWSTITVWHWQPNFTISFQRLPEKSTTKNNVLIQLCNHFFSGHIMCTTRVYRTLTSYSSIWSALMQASNNTLLMRLLVPDDDVFVHAAKPINDTSNICYNYSCVSTTALLMLCCFVTFSCYELWTGYVHGLCISLGGQIYNYDITSYFLLHHIKNYEDWPIFHITGANVKKCNFHS